METLTTYLLTDDERDAIEVLGTLDYRYTDELAQTDPSASERVVRLYRKVRTKGAQLTSDEVLLLILTLGELEASLLTDAEVYDAEAWLVADAEVYDAEVLALADADGVSVGARLAEARRADARQVRRAIDRIAVGWQSPTERRTDEPGLFAGIV